ncbi:MAG: metallopeptidase family protein [Pseudomonadota bacterium]
MARDTLAGLPEMFRPGAAGVVLQVVDWPDARILQQLEIGDPLDLTGLYEGIPLTEKSVMDPAPYPDVIWLFRRPILAEWRARGDVGIQDLVAHVTIHELAHHFGWSDEDIAQIDRWWE